MQVSRVLCHNLAMRAVASSIPVLFVMSCGAADDRPSYDSFVRDSAGVRIITIGTDSLRTLSDHRTTAEAVLRVGTVTGPMEQQFGRVTDAVLLANGDIVVADELSANLRIFDSAGRVRREIGRAGSGPGEFRSPWTVHVLADTISVFDLGRVMVLTWTTDGQPVHSRRLARFGGMRLQWKFGRPGPMGVPVWHEMADSTFRESIQHREGDGPWRVDLVVSRYGWDDSPQIARAPGSLHFWIQMPENETRALMAGGNERFFDRGLARHPLAIGPTVAFLDDGVVLSDGNNSALSYLDPQGVLLRVIQIGYRWEWDGTADEELIRWAVSWWEPARRRLFTRAFDVLPMPRQRNSVFGLRTGSGGRIWAAIEPALFDGEGYGTRWLEVAPDGRPTRWVTTPPGFDVLEFDDSYVLGIERDALDVETVVLYRFRS